MTRSSEAAFLVEDPKPNEIRKPCGVGADHDEDVVMEERLIKSSERIRDLGEVFTPARIVGEVLDLLPQDIWDPSAVKTFLEPACGDGNFLVVVLERKLERITEGFVAGSLPAGASIEAAQFHALEALASIYAVDISIDNVVGGVPGHEIGARMRLLMIFAEWNAFALEKHLASRSPILRAAEWILDHNILVGNMLPIGTSGKATGYGDLPIIEYTFDPTTLGAVLKKTTMGDVIATAQIAAAAEMSLFGPPEPETLWAGKASSIADAERLEAPALRGPARNGSGRLK
jgi:hypothetical protein